MTENNEYENTEYMMELIECICCNVEKPRKDLHWNTIGSYTDTCEDCKTKMSSASTTNITRDNLYDYFVIEECCEECGYTDCECEDDDDDELRPHCYICYNMNMNLNVECFKCDKIYCKSHSYCVLGYDKDMPYCCKECFLN